MERDSARGAIQPGLGFSARAELHPRLKKSHVIETEFQPGRKSSRIHCLSNFKAQIECENIDFNADKVKQYEAVRKAINSASLNQP